jgi:hypothetical protein
MADANITTRKPRRTRRNVITPHIGQVFGNLTFVRMLESRVYPNGNRLRYGLFRCKCGREKEVRISTAGKSVNSCGCLYRSNAGYAVGTRWGRLELLRYVPHTKGSCISAEFKCDCGNITIATLGNVKSGCTQSCGCRQRESTSLRAVFRGDRPAGVNAAMFGVYRKYRDQSRLRGLPFGLSLDDFQIITSSECRYCGSPPSRISHSKALKIDYRYNGVDRLDNTLGYTKSNCVACCTACNMMKRANSAEEFLEQARRIYEHSLRSKPLSIAD